MAKYIVWHPCETPEETEFFENALKIAVEWIKEHKDKIRNNVTITRENLARPIIVARIRGKHIE